MPFTPSHAAAALPLLRTGLPASALIIGTVAPDLPYYLPLPSRWPTHSAVGVVTVDLFLGAASWLLWHGLLSAPALAGAPGVLHARVIGRVQVGLRSRLATIAQWLLVVLGLVVGAATHVLWDEFSHADRWGTQHLQVLREQTAGLAGYQWVQYASGVLGALALLGWTATWWRRTPPQDPPQAAGRRRSP